MCVLVSSRTTTCPGSSVATSSHHAARAASSRSLAISDVFMRLPQALQSAGRGGRAEPHPGGRFPRLTMLGQCAIGGGGNLRKEDHFIFWPNLAMPATSCGRSVTINTGTASVDLLACFPATRAGIVELALCQRVPSRQAGISSWPASCACRCYVPADAGSVCHPGVFSRHSTSFRVIRNCLRAPVRIRKWGGTACTSESWPAGPGRSEVEILVHPEHHWLGFPDVSRRGRPPRACPA